MQSSNLYNSFFWENTICYITRLADRCIKNTTAACTEVLCLINLFEAKITTLSQGETFLLSFGFKMS